MTFIKFARRLSVAISVFFVAMPAVAQTACPSNATSVQGGIVCACPADASSGAVWGSGIYTADSNICTAARHAGAIGAGGGMVQVTMMAGQSNYSGSSANGVNTSNWGSYGSSYVVASAGGIAMQACSRMPGGTDIHECSCAAGAASGTVWGSGPYTNDSDICTAARHSGVIGDGGGNVRVLAVPGLQSYRGSAWNGVTTSDYGSWSGSITFDRN